MDIKNAIIFFTFIVAVNCLISDEIYQVVEKQCNQSKLLLDETLKISYCRSSGDREGADTLCNGIKSIVIDVCNKTSTITLEQVKNSSKFNDTPENFCKEASTLTGLTNVPKNVSENLKLMKLSCSALCTLIDTNSLNPLCPFLVSFSKLKNNIATKKENTTNLKVEKVPDSAAPKKQIDSNNVEKAPLPNQQPQIDANNKLNTSEIRNNEQTKIDDKKDSELNENKKKPSLPNDLDNLENQNPDESFKNPVPEFEPGLGNERADDMENEEHNIDPKTLTAELENTKQESNQESKKSGSPVSITLHSEEDRVLNRDTFVEAESSHFFTYFVFISALCIFFYIAMYNKKKILALMIEGRRSSVKRRPNSAAYSKLDCTLEEAMASGPSTSSSNTLLY